MHADSYYDIASRKANRQLRRGVTGALIAGTLGIPLGAVLGCLSASLLTSSFTWFDGFFTGFGQMGGNVAAGVGALAGLGVGGLSGLTVVKQSAALRLRIALCIGIAAGVATVPVVFDMAAYLLGIEDTQSAYTLLALRLTGLGVGSGCIEAGILSLSLTLIRDRWEWWHRWDSRFG